MTALLSIGLICAIFLYAGISILWATFLTTVFYEKLEDAPNTPLILGFSWPITLPVLLIATTSIWLGMLLGKRFNQRYPK